MKHSRKLTAVVAMVLAPVFAEAAGKAPPEQTDFAERLLQTAAGFSTQGTTYSIAVPLSEAAERIIGEDPHLIRSAIDLQLKLGNRDKALALLAKLRKIDPGDELSQAQTIDLTIDRMQSADDREAYLKQVSESKMVSDNVRSHASLQLFGLLKTRGKDEDANAALEQSLKFNPSNPRALQIKVEQTFGPEGKSPERAAAIINLIKSNPMQPALLSTLSEELARAGLSDEALSMYRRTFDLETSMGVAAPANDAINSAALLLVSASKNEAPAAASAATKLEPNNPRAWFMRLMVEKMTGENKASESTLSDARNTLIRNLMQLHRSIDTTAPEITADTATAMPDVLADIEKLKTMGDQKLGNAYLGALADLAWLDAFFTGKLPEESVVKGIEAVVGTDSPLIARLQGFVAYNNGQLEDAKVKFGAIAKNDPLAQAAMLAIRLKSGEDRNALFNEAAQLVAAVPVDVWSTTVRYLLADFGPINFRTPDAEALRTEVLKLPEEWMDLPKDPSSYYTLELEPVTVGVVTGQPMFMRVIIQNISIYPLVIGPGGVVDQTVVIDASIRSPMSQYIPAVGVARLTGRLVLPPNKTTSAYVRVDSADLNALMATVPQSDVTIYTSAVTNARMGNNNAVVPGPGGTRAQAKSMIERASLSVMKDSSKKEISDNLKSTEPYTRLLAFRALYANFTAARAQQDLPESARTVVAQWEDVFRQFVDRETNPIVKAEGLQLLMQLQKDPNQNGLILRSLLSAKEWETKLTGVLLSISVPQSMRGQFLDPLKEDADETLRRLAQAIAELPDPAPATQPATESPAPTVAP